MCCTLKVIPTFFFYDTATTEIYTLSLHDALPISGRRPQTMSATTRPQPQACVEPFDPWPRSEEHTSELQSPCNLLCRLVLEKKNIGLNISTCSFNTSIMSTFLVNT